MLRKFIAKHIGYPLQDFITGTSINSALNRLKESQYWDESGIYEYRFSKLHLLINHAYNNVPYYKKLFDSIGLKPEDIKHLDDIKKIPILTKKIVIKENDRMLAKGFNMRLAKKGKTGGTTGSPVITYTDIYDRTYTWASYYRWYEWMGINKEDKVVTLWGAKKIINPSIKVKFKDNVAMWLQNQLVIDSFGINNNTINKLYNKIIRFNPSLLKGYLSSLITIAYYIRDKGLPVNKNLKAISSTTETLLPYYRQLLTDTFNTDIYDQYGCGEVSAISYECAKHNGMHLNMEHVLLEVLDDNDKDLINKTGRIIVTGLDNYVMPFIRYENGDLASFTDKKCMCGVNQPLIKSIEGRTIDTITLADGAKVHGVFFTDILYELGFYADKISKFQVVQTIPGEIEFKLETVNLLNEKEQKLIESSVKPFFNKVYFNYLDKIELEKNGKFLYIKNRINN